VLTRRGGFGILGERFEGGKCLGRKGQGKEGGREAAGKAKKALDKRRSVWYHSKVRVRNAGRARQGRGALERPGGRAKGQKKVLDKPRKLWYNENPVVHPKGWANGACTL